MTLHGTTAASGSGNLMTDFSVLLKNNDISSDVQKHLVTVYSYLGIALGLAAVSSYFAPILFSFIAPEIYMLISLGLVFYFGYCKFNQTKVPFWSFLLFTGSGGAAFSNIVSFLLDDDKMLLVKAFGGTTLVFFCFTIAALVAKRRSYLFIGGAALSALSLLSLMSMVNLFFRSSAMYNVQLYGGLLIFLMYIIYNTQIIIERASVTPSALRDPLWDAITLFDDFRGVFVRILVILMKNKEEKRRNNSSNNRR